MITEADLRLHSTPDVDYDWGETYYFSIFVPEAGINGFVYLVFRPGVGAVQCDVQFRDGSSESPFDAIYIDAQNHLPLPKHIDHFSLPNGLRLRATSPTEYRLDYVGVDDTEIHLDFTGLSVPYDIHDPEIDPMAQAGAAALEESGFGVSYAGHFDLTTRVNGHVVVRGARHDVDSMGTMDRSWGPRPERGMRSMGWINAHFDDLQLHSIWKFTPGAPGEEHAFVHGYAIESGELHGGTGGSARVVRDGGPLGTSFELTVVAGGREHHVTGTPITNYLWMGYACCPTAVAMVEWRTDDGRTGVGTSMEAFPIDQFAGGALHRALDTPKSSGV